MSVGCQIHTVCIISHFYFIQFNMSKSSFCLNRHSLKLAQIRACIYTSLPTLLECCCEIIPKPLMRQYARCKSISIVLQKTAMHQLNRKFFEQCLHCSVNALKKKTKEKHATRRDGENASTLSYRLLDLGHACSFSLVKIRLISRYITLKFKQVTHLARLQAINSTSYVCLHTVDR